MSPMATVQLEFLGQSLWWAGVVGVTGAALLIYAVLLWRDGKRAAVEGEWTGRTPVTAPPTERLDLLGQPLSLVSILAGIASLVLTGVILWLASGTANMLALVWTLAMTFLAIFLFYRRIYRYLSRFRMWTLLLLRIAAILTLVTLLFQPMLGFMRRLGFTIHRMPGEDDVVEATLTL